MVPRLAFSLVPARDVSTGTANNLSRLITTIALTTEPTAGLVSCWTNQSESEYIGPKMYRGS